MKKSRLSFFLIIGSMVLLVGLELWWLRSEYRSAADSFERETDLIFKSTIKQITDSAFYGNLRKLVQQRENNDSLGISFPPVGFWKNRSEGSGQIKIESIEIKAESGEDDQHNKLSKIEIKRQSGSDSSARSNVSIFRSNNDKGRRDVRFVFDIGLDSVKTDSIQHIFGNALNKEHARLKLHILQVEKSLPTFYLENDSIPFTTDFYRLGNNYMYAAQFEGVRCHIIQTMLPKIGFSLLLTALVLLSFMVLHRSRKSQERLLMLKNEFIANVTHELKTPVATVGVALEAIRDFDVLKDPEKASKYLEMAEKEVQRLNSITDKILKESVFDFQQEIRIHKKPVILSECIQNVAKSMEMTIKATGMELKLHLESNAEISGHEAHLEEMLQNLIENALKYAATGKIIIRLYAEDRYLRLIINDEGPGIPDEHLSKVMDKFYRVPTGDIHNVKGYGLGLSYVAGVVKSHHASINLTNKKEGGLRVEIKFPIVQD